MNPHLSPLQINLLGLNVQNINQRVVGIQQRRKELVF